MSVRYSVQPHPAGFAVWEVCPDVVATGDCRFSLWCRCQASDGGPLAMVVKVCPDLGVALGVADVLERSA